MNKQTQNINQLYGSIFKTTPFSVTDRESLKQAYWDIKKVNYYSPLFGFRPDTIRSVVHIGKLISGLAESYKEIVIFAIDAISYKHFLSSILKAAAKTSAVAGVLSSVFPTTSSSSWTSIITGDFPSNHGVYGTAFYLPQYQASYNWILNAFAIKENFIPLKAKGITPRLNLSSRLTLFQKVSDQGFSCYYLDTHGPDNPFPLLGITQGAKHLESLEGYNELKRKPEDFIRYFLSQTDSLLSQKPEKKLIWNYIDLDDFIHENGFISLSQTQIWEILFNYWQTNTQDSRIFLLISDHGQTTQINPGVNILKISALNDDLAYNAAGAGRTMFYYPKPDRMAQVRSWLEHLIGNSGLLLERSQLVDHGLITSDAVEPERIGHFVALATHSNFPSAGYKYVSEHGSLNEEEMFVPIIIQT